MIDEDPFRFEAPRRGFSVKPGRGPSAFGALAGIGAVLFGILWTILAFSITRNAPFPLVGTIFPLFGVIFVLVGIGRVIYDLRNATGRDRNSVVDVVPEAQERDPLSLRFGRQQQDQSDDTVSSARASSVERRLRALEALRRQGTVTEAEYAEQRARILREL
jgi:hypothetical protein